MENAVIEKIRKNLEIFSPNGLGITSWLYNNNSDEVISRLNEIESAPIGKAQLNQLLIISHFPGISEGFFTYYWGSVPNKHPYDVSKVEDFNENYFSTSTIQSTRISSLKHLQWGFRRLFIDGLLFFGNITQCFKTLGKYSLRELKKYFIQMRYDESILRTRGALLEIEDIPRDDRYLISENACKNIDVSKGPNKLEKDLVNRWHLFDSLNKGKKIQIKYLFLNEKEWEKIISTEQGTLDGYLPDSKKKEIDDYLIDHTAEEIGDKWVTSEEDIRRFIKPIIVKYDNARTKALSNTKRYLSMVDDLDVYVATSMRNRENFREMGDKCEKIFKSKISGPIKLRYFDPTQSAANGHLDKGLIECLMVKCAKILVYFLGKKESWGKDVEAAMALSHGKSVIFVCDEAEKSEFYNHTHPLTRLIDIKTGVAVGAMVTADISVVPKLILKVLSNDMEYNLECSEGYYYLKERITHSTVRIQTNDELLTETFWNHYPMKISKGSHI